MAKTETYRQQTRPKMGSHVFPPSRPLDQQILEHVIADQLTCGHEDGSVHIGPKSASKGRDSLLTHDADKPIDGVTIVPSLRQWERAVVLHAYIDHIGRVADGAAHATRDGRTEDHFPKSGF
ncbi:hypothetical protein BC937DRAFT_94614 [Endogone sp. FLAS-F59071]|nr:hypothetical protein BC937DRAFT_94614 [Endogone sp. FLAS-F59071]|eukprot:RUS13906.1 hypothetical protein BC937DRAFT_94614 [Endogone sp. FLAS-F59071]